MPLPKIATPEFEIKLFSQKAPIRYRPFLMKEEKLLLMALESKKEDTMINAVKTILSGCCLPGQKIDFDRIPLFDIEFWFLNLRAKSVGEIIKLLFKCEKCEAENPIEFNIDEVELFVPEDHKNLIDLTDEIKVEMNYPTVKQFAKFQNPGKMTETLFDMTRECLKTIYHNDEVFDAKVQTKKELDDFILSLRQEQFGKLVQFFETMPKLNHTVVFDCNQCNHNNITILQGIESFFLSA